MSGSDDWYSCGGGMQRGTLVARLANKPPAAKAMKGLTTWSK